MIKTSSLMLPGERLDVDLAPTGHLSPPSRGSRPAEQCHLDCSTLNAVPMISLQVRGSEVEPSGGPTCSIAFVVSSLEARSPEKPTRGQTHNPILNPCHDRVVNSLDALLVKVRDCDLCSSDLRLGPRPIVQISQSARILVAGQAPGRKVHESGIPWDDPSGARLRELKSGLISIEVSIDATPTCSQCFSAH